MKRVLLFLLFSLSVVAFEGQVISLLPATAPAGIGSPVGVWPCNSQAVTSISAAFYVDRSLTVGNSIWRCVLLSDGATYAWIAPFISPFLGSANTSPIGGSSLLSGGCSTGTATISGIAPGSNGAVVGPLGDPGSGLLMITAIVSAANTVMVRVCNLSVATLTPTAVTYKVFAF